MHTVYVIISTRG